MTRPTSLNRRALLQRASAMAAFAIVGACEMPAGSARSKLSSYPFTLGVASGDPVSDGFVIWTRLAPNPFDRDALTDETVKVIWEVASDEQMQNVVQKGMTLARRALGHSVHVEVRGLPSQRPYFYRFRLQGGDASPVGRAWAAPRVGSPLERLRFALTSCQHYEQGYFTPYAAMLSDKPDLIIHVGDYIYESSWGEQIRRHDGPEPYTLEEYRDRHALYKTDPHLQAAHSACPWLVTWDDHEVDNDYQGLDSEDFEDHDAFAKRRAAAYQAYYEHMPLRHIAVPRLAEMRLYQRSTFGDLIEFTVFDNRQYRSPEACRDPEHGGGRLVGLAACKELTDPNREFIGKDQEAWVFNGFAHAKAKWNAIAQSQLFSRLKQKTADGQEAYWTEDWNGYPNARDRIIGKIAQTKLANPVILGGDIHSFWVNDVKADFNDPQSATVATEFVGTSLTSAGPAYEPLAKSLPDNPHVKLFESRKRGYAFFEATQNALNADLRVVDDVRDPNTKDGSLAKFTVEAGKPGAEKA